MAIFTKNPDKSGGLRSILSIRKSKDKRVKFKLKADRKKNLEPVYIHANMPLTSFNHICTHQIT